MKYTIAPDAPGHPDTAFKVFGDGVKVATLTKEQVIAALGEDVSERIKAVHREIQEVIGDLERSATDEGLDGQSALSSLNDLDLKLRTNQVI